VFGGQQRERKREREYIGHVNNKHGIQNSSKEFKIIKIIKHNISY
jgi:uncharacterized C2H2 Zn-finger protein